MTKRYRVGIVGYGVAGGAAAIMLARQGHSVTLFERSAEIGPAGAGILLQPSGQVVLQRLGLLDEIARCAEPIHALDAVTHRGHRLTLLNYSDAGPGCIAYGVHRGVLFDSIRKLIESEDIEVRLGLDIRSGQIVGEAIFAVDDSGRSYGPFDFLVAADGSRSALRSSCGLGRWVHTYQYGVIWAVGHSNAVRGKLFQVVRGARTLIGMLPMGDGECTLFCSATPEEWSDVRIGGFERWRARVIELCPLAETLFGSISGPDDLRFTDYRHAWLKRWFDDGIVFVGDAAHAMSPHLGQGVNLALLDAEALADAVEDTAEIDSAFRQYVKSRRHHIRHYSWLTFLLTPFFQSNSAILGLGRDVCLPIMGRIPMIRKIMARSMAGVSSLTRPLHIPAPAPSEKPVTSPGRTI